ncbi:N-formylglutamate deformylase [alpha proteobacterium BAL199]|nr:N-formylglutamate deformylase [alpha proteobacterium BAL199]
MDEVLDSGRETADSLQNLGSFVPSYPHSQSDRRESPNTPVDNPVLGSPAFDRPVTVERPPRQTLAVVVSSPHSGQRYPQDLLSCTDLDPLTLRSSEDTFVDELFASAPELGAPLVKAEFPRVYVDANREPFELDPAMFDDALPDYVTTQNARIAAGLGTIARVVSNSAPVYRGKLRFADALQRIDGCWRPFHAALADAIEETLDRFGYCILLDAHSMPSNVLTLGADGRAYPVADVVLGDCHGGSCSTQLVQRCERVMARQGYRVHRNTPYAGGFVTRHYGRPESGVHALQIELKRGLYMNERRFQHSGGFARVAADMRRLVAALGSFDPRRPWGDAD